MNKDKRTRAKATKAKRPAAPVGRGNRAAARTRAEQREHETAVLYTLSREVSASLSLDKVVQAALAGITTAVAPDLVLLFLTERDELVLRGVRTAHPSERMKEVGVHQVGECICELAVKAGRALYSRDARTDPRCARGDCKRAGLASFAALPLRAGGRVLGVLGLVAHREERDFEKQATFLETLTNEIAIGLQNALLFEEVRRHDIALSRVNEELRAEISERSRIEEELRESRERLRQLVENLSEVLWLTDWTTRTLLYVSPSYETVFGRSRESIFENRRSWVEVIHPDDRARIDRTFAAKGERGEYTEEEYRIVQPEGEIRWIRDRSIPIRDEHGAVVRWVGVAEDITARKLAEESLRSTTERLSLIARTTAAVVGVIPLAEQAHEMARQVRAAFGADASAIRVLDGEELVLLASDGLPLDRTQPRLPLNWGIGGKILTGRRPVFVRNVHDDAVLAAIAHDPPGTFEFTSYAGAPLLLDGRVIGLLGVYALQEMRDFDERSLEDLQILANNITVAIVNDRLHRELMSERDRLAAEVVERRKTEERLRESEKRHRLLTEYSRDIIFRCSSEGTLRHVSPACRQITGYEPEELIGQHITALVHQDDVATAKHGLADFAAQRAARTYQFRARRKDGAHVWMEVMAEAVRGQVGDTDWEIFGVARDVTARKRAEEDLRQHHSELAHVSRLSSLAQLTAGIAHELNQPLYAIVNYTESCLRTAQADDARPEMLTEDLRKVIVQAERASAVIRRLRDILKRPSRRRGTVNLNALLRDVVVLAEPELRGAAVVPKLRLHSGLAPIEADRIEIEQVALNLIRNALEAMRDTPVPERKLVLETEQTSGEAVEMRVIDTGQGVPADALERIFDPFYSTKNDGMGMGLSISRAIVEAHGGQLWVESERRAGSVFRVSLPTSAQGECDVSGTG